MDPGCRGKMISERCFKKIEKIHVVDVQMHEIDPNISNLLRDVDNMK